MLTFDRRRVPRRRLVHRSRRLLVAGICRSGRVGGQDPVRPGGGARRPRERARHRHARWPDRRFRRGEPEGGVKGRKLELMSRDDGYEPNKSIEATKALIDAGVFALVGPVGTPTSMAAHPIAKEAGIPFIGPFTGRGVAAHSLSGPHRQHSRLLFPGDRGDGGAPDQGSRFHQDRHLLSGRRLRPRRARGYPTRPAEARHEARRRRHVRAQHGRRKGRAPGDPQGRPAGRDHDRAVQALRRVHQVVPHPEDEPGLREHLIRRQRRARRASLAAPAPACW